MAHAGIPVRYDPLDVEPSALADVIRDFAAEETGGNVTIPHKESAFVLCDRVTEVAQAVRAVNTFWVEDGVLVGTNTDVGGFDTAVHDLLAREHSSSRRVAVIGAGGSAAAVLAAVSTWNCADVAVWSRSHQRALDLAQRFDAVRAELDLAAAVHEADLVVNATPIGMHDDGIPVPISFLSPGAALFDLVYRNDETEWVRSARSAGHAACDGLGMLIEQGALAFRCWFGIEPDRSVMWEAATRR